MDRKDFPVTMNSPDSTELDAEPRWLQMKAQNSVSRFSSSSKAVAVAAELCREHNYVISDAEEDSLTLTRKATDRASAFTRTFTFPANSWEV